MTIARADVKLMKSERLTDNEDGGGRMTGTEVQDGVANNLFPDISRLDRVYGRVSMRKAFLSVNTANSDVYYGAHAIVSNPPEDDSVHTLLFTTKSPSDERNGAQDKVESYLVKSYKTNLKLLGDHLTGQSSITCYQSTNAENPSIGDVLVLVQGENEQFIRIVDLTIKTTLFNYDKNGDVGSFTGNKLTIEMNQLLQFDFTGNEPHPTAPAITSLYACTIANASRYYGVDKLEETAHVGQKVLKATSIFKPIVPATNKESVILDQYPFIDDECMMAMGADNSFSKTLLTPAASLSAGKTLYVGVGVFPGSLKVTVGTTVYKDRGGEIIPSNPLNDVGITGTIEYSTGKLFLQGGSGTYTVTAQCTPAANISGERITEFKEITIANVAFNHVFSVGDSLKQLPAKGTVTADYLSFGKWYRLYDNGSGSLEGKVAGVGAGSVDYDTGTISVTCAALPDIGSCIIISFGPRQGVAELTVPSYTWLGQDIFFAETSIHPGTIQLSWKTKAGATVTATDNGNGKFVDADLISGNAAYFGYNYKDANSSVQNGQARATIVPALPPDTATPITVTYNESAAGHFYNEHKSIPEKAGLNENITFTLATAPIVPGTLLFTVLVRRPYSYYYGWESQNYYNAWVTIRDDGAGNLKLYYDGWYMGYYSHWSAANRAIAGSVNYATGEVTFNLYANNISLFWYDYGYNGYPYYSRYVTTTGVEAFGGELYVHYLSTPVVGAQHTKQVAWDSPKFVFTGFTRDVVPTSVRVQAGTTVLYDKSGGLLQHTVSTTTGAGTTAGSIDYETGVITVSDFSLFANNAPVALVGIGMLTKDDMRYPVSSAIFRTLGSPLVPGSLSIAAHDFGTKNSFALTVDDQGVITSAYHPTLTGKVSFDTGVITLNTHSAQRMLFGPEISYNAVYLQNLPLDPTLLGLDPTKLPLDGRVPIFRKADVIVVHHTDTYQCPTPPETAAGHTYDVGRANLALVEVYDVNNQVVNTNDYTVDLALGTVTFDADLTGYVEPLRILHRIEDMLLATEVYINGKIETAGALSHEYPANDTQVSSALLFGDLASRVLKLFSQATWTAVWSDTRIGNNTTGQYNDLQYPIQVTNEEAIEERWAIVFTSATNFTVNGETLGQIGTGNTGINCAPLNTLTGKPYFTIPYQGWGTGWATGNVLRFNTQAASAPMWLIRTTLAGPVEEPVDKFILQLRGDAN